MTVRVVVADDHSVVRAGFAALLDAQPDIEVVGVAADGDAAVAAARRHRPDVVLMDIRMPYLSGLAATRELLRGGATTPRVLILTTFDVDDYVYEALQAGASGFLLKDATPGELLYAVRVVAAGDALLAPALTRRLIADVLRRRPGPAPEPPPELAGLTGREREVLTALAYGLSNAEIAGRLGISTETVKTHVARLLAKLGLRDRVQAVVLAYRSGLVPPGG